MKRKRFIIILLALSFYTPQILAQAIPSISRFSRMEPCNHQLEIRDQRVRDSALVSIWDKDLEEWYYTQRNVYNHDEQGRDKVVITDTWNRNQQQWEPKNYTVCAFSAASNECIRQTIGPATEQFANNYRTLNIFNPAHQEINRYYFFWNVNKSLWDTTNGSTYLYDPEGNNVEETSSYWNPNGSGPAFTERKSYTYDGQNRVISLLIENWEADKWLQSSKTEYQYTNLSHLMTSYNWDAGLAKWSLSYQTIEEYNQKGDIIQAIYSSWESAIEEWQLNFLGQYVYDDFGQIIRYTQFDWKDGIWIKSYMNEYFYSVLSTTSIIQGHLVQGMVVPNPATDRIHLMNANNQGYSLYNMQGQVIRQADHGAQEIEVDLLPPGVYFVRYQTIDGEEVVIKWLKA